MNHQIAETVRSLHEATPVAKDRAVRLWTRGRAFGHLGQQRAPQEAAAHVPSPRRSPRSRAPSRQAEAESLLGRLSHDVSTLDDGGDPANRQALADAAERYNTAGAQLGEASTVGQMNVVRNLAIEGLHSTRLVRTRLGLEPRAGHHTSHPAAGRAPTATGLGRPQERQRRRRLVAPPAGGGSPALVRAGSPRGPGLPG